MLKILTMVCLSLATLLATQSGYAQEMSQVTACEHTIDYRIQPPPPGTPANVAAFLGAWVGKWKPWPFPGSAVSVPTEQCFGMIIYKVDAEGNVDVGFFWGTMYRAKPNKERRSGRITGNKLVLPKTANGLYDIVLTMTTPEKIDATKREGIWPGKLCRHPFQGPSTECKLY